MHQHPLQIVDRPQFLLLLLVLLRLLPFPLRLGLGFGEVLCHVDGGGEADDGFGFLSREGFGVEDEAEEGEVDDLEKERKEGKSARVEREHERDRGEGEKRDERVEER